MDRPFTIESEAIPSKSAVVALQGYEAISQPYRFELLIRMSAEESAGLDMASAIGKRATLRFLEKNQTRESIHGSLTTIELVHALVDDALYRAVIMPELWWASLSQHSRVFVDQSVPEIVKKVLKANGLADEHFRFVLENESRDYPKLEHVCQYRESDLDFVSRLLEREGIYYFFEHGDEREKLVITDTRSILDQMEAETRSYSPVTDPTGRLAEGFSTFSCKCTAVPTQVAVKDYDYLKPNLTIASVASSGRLQSHTTSGIESHHENARTPSMATRLAKVRAQKLTSRSTTYYGEGMLHGLRPGTKYELQLDPRFSSGHLSRLNGEYLTTELAHRGHVTGISAAVDQALEGLGFALDEPSYRVQVTAIRADVQFRPEQRTPVPRIDGLEDATIDGPTDDVYAQVDDHGRYLVKIRFDEDDTVSGMASSRVRMLQPHGGSQEGMHFPLRKGTEVLLAFLGGDPDQPLIVGVAHNALTPSLVTAGNATKNVLQSGGGNRLEMEDTAGGQYTRLSSPTENSFLHIGAPNPPYNVRLSTDGKTLIRSGGKTDVRVGADMTQEVTDNRTETVHGDVRNEYDGDRVELVKGDVINSYDGVLNEEIKGNVKNTYHGSFDEVVDGTSSLAYRGEQERMVSANVKDTVQGNLKELVTGDVDSTVSGKVTSRISGKLDQTVTGGVKITTPATYTVQAAGEILLQSGVKVRCVAPESWQDVLAKYAKLTAVSFELAGLKSETVLTVKDTNAAVKLDLIGVKIDRTGFVSANEATKLKTFGYYVCVGALFLSLEKFVLFG